MVIITMLSAVGIANAVPVEVMDSTGFVYPQLHAAIGRMEQEQPTTIVFFGGSITWGATATDPLRTSWRALFEQELHRRYPRTPLKTVDAAIGGQPSKLGVFRMDRDVLPYKPDICFVEFAVNDWRMKDSQETIEGIVRKLRTCRPDMAIVFVLIGSKPEELYDQSPSQPMQVELAEYYGLPFIDIFSAVKAKLGDELTTQEILTDGCHPNDRGYRLYADIVIAQLDALSAMTGKSKSAPSAPLTANRYESAHMVELSKLSGLADWKTGVPSVVGTWFDQTPSRWFDSTVSPTKAGARIEFDIDVTGAGLYFELVPKGKPLVLKVDDVEHLEINTENSQPFARVQSAFRLVDSAGKHQLTLEAPEGGPAVAAYLLVTNPDKKSEFNSEK